MLAPLPPPLHPVALHRSMVKRTTAVRMTTMGGRTLAEAEIVNARPAG
ncbi:MAG: hypothetical protein HY057_07920 [Rhodospirillales bacterium]|nr:hypothetical protein [Rhodospirillales bacterium]